MSSARHSATAGSSSRPASRVASSTISSRLKTSATAPSSAAARRSKTASSFNAKGDPAADAASRPALATAEIIEKATLALNGLSTRDALTVWKALGLYLSEQLLLRRRVVQVDRFGVFGYNDASEGVFSHTSIFLQSNRLKETISKQGLRGQPALAANAEPMSKVNAMEIGQEYLQNCGREMVESVITHVVAYVGKMAKQGRAMRLSLLPLGEWSCTGESATFTFLSEFQQQMVKSTTSSNIPRSGGGPPKKQEKDKVASQQQQQKIQDVRDPEPSLTMKKLEAHTDQQRASRTNSNEKPQQQQQQQRSSERRSKDSSSRRMAWSESEPSSNQTKQSARQQKARPKAAAAAVAPPARSTSHEGGEGGIVGRVKAKLMERCGEKGLNALQRVLSLIDTSGDGVLTPQELKFGLRDLGIELTVRELQQVVAYFDRNGDGVVALDELLGRLRGKSSLSRRRRALVEKAFDCMDPKRRGVVSLDDLKENYDVSLLPRVRAGKKTKAQALSEFLREWETSVEHNNGIPREGFVEYYHNVSACMSEDSDFELLMRQTWHVAAAENNETESDTSDNEMAKPIVSPTKKRGETPPAAQPAIDHPQDQDEWQYLRSILLPARVGVHTQPKLDDMCRRLGANRVWGDGNETMNTRAFANALSIVDRQLHSKDAQHLAQVVVGNCGTGSSDMISLKVLYQSVTGTGSPGASATASPAPPPSSGTTTIAHEIIERIRARLLQRLQAQQTSTDGAMVGLGLNALQRTLRLLDTNNDKRLSKDELKLGLRKLGVEINFHELDQLFTCLDADRSGCIDADEFLVSMRGSGSELTPSRLALVHMAFDLLDRDRDGSVTLQELSKAYDTSKHPDVLAGRITSSDAVRQFAQQWDTQERDGVITRAEFELYYCNVSACVDRDDYFELMMRNAWHISGGTGQSANTSNRRVLVTKVDGSQSVHEVKNDLGIRASDTAKIRANLLAQGVVANEISMHGEVEDKDEGKQSTKASPPPTFTTRGSTWKTSTGQPQQPAARRGADPTPMVRSHARRRGQDHTMDHRSEPAGAAAPSDFFASSGGGGDQDTAAHVKQQRLRARHQRERAALMIQAYFRGFKSRKFVECVRRQMAAQETRKHQCQQEQDPRKRVVARTALKSYYGF